MLALDTKGYENHLGKLLKDTNVLVPPQVRPHWAAVGSRH